MYVTLQLAHKTESSTNIDTIDSFTKGKDLRTEEPGSHSSAKVNKQVKSRYLTKQIWFDLF